MRANVAPKDLFEGHFFRKETKTESNRRKKCIKVPRKIKKFIRIYDKI